MTIYQNDITEIRLDTGIDLDDATSFIIKVRKPSGTELDWTAARYLTTTSITYTTLSTDLDELGTYILQSYILWDTVPGPLGDAVTIVVEAPFTVRVNVPDLITKFAVFYRYMPVQTFAQYNTDPETGTDADIQYEEFETYTELALDELDSILAARSITLTSIQEKIALCHLVADYIEMGTPDWSFRSQSQAPGVSFSRGEETGPRAALNKMLDVLEIASRRASITGGRGANTEIIRIKDAKNYPARWKRTCIPAYDHTTDGFDESEVSDMGYDYNQTTGTEW